LSQWVILMPAYEGKPEKGFYLSSARVSTSELFAY
jgi:hypothetical protein